MDSKELTNRNREYIDKKKVHQNLISCSLDVGKEIEQFFTNKNFEDALDFDLPEVSCSGNRHG